MDIVLISLIFKKIIKDYNEKYNDNLNRKKEL